jgi:alkylation response protein AidB-like acyl-CoA dehydrogenase
MRFALSAEQAELKKVARKYLAAHWASAQVRGVIEGRAQGGDEAGEAAALAWRGPAEDLGWAAVLVPEAHGGMGLGWTEACLLAEETGRALACVPLLSTACMATGALLAAADDEQRARYLPDIAAGRVRAALAFAEGTEVDSNDVATTAREVPGAREAGGGYELSGVKRYVVDGATADVILVTARDAGGPAAGGDGAVALYAVDAKAPGVEIAATPGLDATRALATITLRDARVDRRARMGDAAAIARAIDHAGIALAAESLGGAERCLEMATEYAKTRVQFDRPIGSFQAIKHKLADLFTAVETARSAVSYAASVAGGSDGAEVAIAAALAKSYATEVFFRCAAENLQIHGGIGFTWEHDAHLFLKRARGSLVLLGAASRDRERVARAIGLDAAGRA